jgi:hypothetical protein
MNRSTLCVLPWRPAGFRRGRGHQLFDRLSGGGSAAATLTPDAGWATLWLDTTAHTMPRDELLGFGRTTAAHIHCCTAA